jgi:hypothetical protein
MAADPFNPLFSEIIALQNQIIQQQTQLEANLNELQRLTNEVDKKITEIGVAIGYYVHPSLEEAVETVGVQAGSIDELVPDTAKKHKTKRKE